MPNNESLSESERLAPRRARDEAQLLLGQIHGVVWLVVNDVDKWLPKGETTEGGEPELTADDVRRAAAEVHSHFGVVHAALNSGRFDEELVKVGMTGAQGQAKRKGFLPAIRRFFTTKGQAISQLRSSLRWSNTLIGCIAAALKKEIERVPGAGAAAEGIKEFIELLLNATEPMAGNEDITPPQQRVGARRGGE